MIEQPTALRLADALANLRRWHELTDDECDEAAAELRRLHEAHDWQYKMAGERLRRIEKLEAVNRELLEALIELTETGAEAWGEDRPCVRIGLAVIAKTQGQA